MEPRKKYLRCRRYIPKTHCLLIVVTDVHPSEQVLESLSTALHLKRAERSHLFRLARRQDPGISSPLEETINFTLEQTIKSNLNP